ncbi:MAG TPA: transcriptional regulator, partial [Bacteroidia bacterium]|nr:transcriptional regulator [Bacteroidia bacterium]
MELFTLKEDIRTFYVAAKSFPDGITEAFDTLSRIVPQDEERILFGITIPRPDGKIEYRAAVSELHNGEGEKYGCPVYIIPKGGYLSETLKDWRNNVQVIGETFRKLGD